MKRPTNTAIISVFMYAGAAVAALAALALFALALLVATGEKSGEPVSVAFIGMGLSGGLALLILALLTTSLGMGLPEYRDWARSARPAEMLSALELRARNILSSATRLWAAALAPRTKNHKLSFRPSK